MNYFNLTRAHRDARANRYIARARFKKRQQFKRNCYNAFLYFSVLFVASAWAFAYGHMIAQ